MPPPQIPILFSFFFVVIWEIMWVGPDQFFIQAEKAIELLVLSSSNIRSTAVSPLLCFVSFNVSNYPFVFMVSSSAPAAPGPPIFAFKIKMVFPFPKNLHWFSPFSILSPIGLSSHFLPPPTHPPLMPFFFQFFTPRLLNPPLSSHSLFEARFSSFWYIFP